MRRFRLAHPSERQRADSREAAGNEARATQECTTIDPLIPQRLQRNSERAAAGLSLRSLDQHGSLLTSSGSD